MEGTAAGCVAAAEAAEQHTSEAYGPGHVLDEEADGQHRAQDHAHGEPCQPEEPGDHGEREHHGEADHQRDEQARHAAASPLANPPAHGAGRPGEPHDEREGHRDEAEGHEEQQRNPDDGDGENHHRDHQQRHEQQLRGEPDEPGSPWLGRHAVRHAPDGCRQHRNHQCGEQADEPDPDEGRDEIDGTPKRVANRIAEPVPVAPRATAHERAERRPGDPDLVNLPRDHGPIGALDAAANGGHITAHAGLGPEMDGPSHGHHVAVHPPVDPGRAENRHDVVADRFVFGNRDVAAEADPRAPVAVACHFTPAFLFAFGRRRVRRGRSRRRDRRRSGPGEERAPPRRVQERQLGHEVGIVTETLAQFAAGERRAVHHHLAVIDVDGPGPGSLGLRDQDQAAADLDDLVPPFGPLSQLLQLGTSGRVASSGRGRLGGRRDRGRHQEREGQNRCAHVSSPATPSACAAPQARTRRQQDSVPATRAEPDRAAAVR